MSYIETYTGLKFDIVNPSSEQVELSDIAHALACTCRYGGHSRYFYSVAEHSIHVQELVKNRGHNKLIQLYALLHDAHEAYLGDIPRPIKEVWPFVKEFENSVQEVIWQRFKLPAPSDEDKSIIKKADDDVLACESKQLIHCKHIDLIPPSDVNFEPKRKTIREIEDLFIQKAKSLIEF